MHVAEITRMREYKYTCKKLNSYELYDDLFTGSANRVMCKGTDAGESFYLCQLCDELFKRLKAVTVHKAVHSENRPHQC